MDAPEKARSSKAEPSATLLAELMQVARNSALEEMASGFAHELNQPIGAIATFAQTGQRMLNRPQPMVQAAADVFDHISAESMKAGEGIHRIRRMFDAADGSRVDVRFTDVLAELLPVLQLIANGSGARIAATIADPAPKVTIDARRIQHVLFALVLNALEATRSDDPAPVVRIDVTVDRYGTAVSITDRGAGIADHVKPHLFRPFFTTKPRGTGLGLASSRTIIESHGGSIGYENVAGGGSRFWFRLPAAAAAA